MRLWLILIPGLALAQSGNISGSVDLTNAFAGSWGNSALCLVDATSNCNPITSVITADPDSGANFGGRADPTLRQDPITNNLWMCYSWLELPHAGTQTTASHCIVDTGTGLTWDLPTHGVTASAILWDSLVLTNPTTSATNYTSNEVTNIFGVSTAGTVQWFGTGQNYWNPAGSGGSGTQPTAARFRITSCTSNTGPMCMSSSTFQYLGASTQNTDANFPVLTLDTLAGATQPAACASSQGPNNVFIEPAITVLANGDLHYYIQCKDLNHYFDFVASGVVGNTNATTWTWAYVGAFLLKADAQSVCQYVNACQETLFPTEFDMVRCNSTLTVPQGLCGEFTVAAFPGGARRGRGWIIAPLASLNPPVFLYDVNGNMVVIASGTSTDSSNTVSVTNTPNPGPGSSTYDKAATSIGMVGAHKQTANAPQNGAFYTYLFSTGLLP